MTGIERLRKMAETDMANGYASESRVLSNIADQIEREQVEAAADHAIVASVASEMERHVLGHEGMEDSPVARWARELRAALGGHVEEVADVATIRKDAYDAYEWVEAHDGLDAVKRRWECLSYYVDPVPRACMERRLASRQRQIDESHGALRRRNARIVELEHERDELREMVRSLNALTDEMEKRLMSEGMEWLRVDGKPVVIGELMRAGCIKDCKVAGIDPANSRLILVSDEIEKGKATYFPYFARHCHRPAPKVLDADGVEIREGDTVWHVETGQEYAVVSICYEDGIVVIRAGDKTSEHEQYAPSLLTHRAPVLAADGKPLREGETVWHEDGSKLIVEGFIHNEDGETIVKVHDMSGTSVVWSDCRSLSLTHERPDSWERLAEDAAKTPCVYFGQSHGCGGCPHYPSECHADKARDLVRRAKALAGGA